MPDGNNTPPPGATHPPIGPDIPVGAGAERSAGGSVRPIARTLSGGQVTLPAHPGGLLPARPEQVIDRLSAAAQRIAEEERTASILHKRPHASRLAPLRDISADIQRESTPSLKVAHPPIGPDVSVEPIARTLSGGQVTLSARPGGLVPAPDDHIIDANTPVSGQFPNISITPVGMTQPSVGASAEQSEAQNQRSEAERLSILPSRPAPIDRPASARDMPDLWPWLMEPDPEESDTDHWAHRTDPLTLRHFPTSIEAQRIKEQDFRRAMAEGMITSSLPQRRPARPSRARIIFILLTILAMLALIVDGILLSAALLHPHRNANDSNGPPTLTLSPNAASIGDRVTVRISHFAPSTSVLLTHDIQQTVQTTRGSSLISLDPSGNASVSIIVDKSWGPGFHPLEAEDVTTRYTASAYLQIRNAGETRPSHLLIDTTLLNMGPDFLGANTIKTLTLRNAGDGTPISWTASSNKPWLMLSPTQGIFSDSQPISIAVDRANLKPGNYNDGLITISSTVDPPQHIKVAMSVNPLPKNPGPVLAVTPAVLSFTATDGAANPAAQSLTMSNPGTQPLNWSLTGNAPAITANQTSLFHALGAKADWLSTNITSGTILPGASRQVQININSRSLLPGTYTGTLVFTPTSPNLPAGQATYDKPQTVTVSLTVQPRCGLSTSTGNMSFTAVATQSNPSNQALGLSATPSCTTPISWTAMTSASWLTITPNSGHLNGEASATTSVAVNATILPPGSYNAVIAFLTAQSTQSVAIQLTVQPPPPPAAPIIALSGLTLNFSNTQGQQSPASQIVTITNSGRSTLYWSTKVTQLGPSWLADSPTGGTIPPAKTGQLSVNVNTTGLTPGTYVGQIGLTGQDSIGHTAGGSPQTITVNLLVLPSCTLVQPSSSSLVFNAAQAGPNPPQQTVQLTATGNCAWPLTWHATVSPGASWLNVTPASGSISVSGQSVTIAVAPDITNLQAAPAPYTAQVTITATDSAAAQPQGSPQAFSVSLNILQPCQLTVSPSTLAFTAPNPQPQTLTLGQTGNCVLPVSWTAVILSPGQGSASSSWLLLSPTSGSNTGTSTLNVSVNSANLPPGTYTAQITITAKDPAGNPLQGSGQVVNVTLTVPAFTVSGTILACTDPTCTISAPLPNASLTVLNSLNTQVATATSDPSGNYTLPSLAPGSYTVTVTGTDSTGKHFSGSASLLITADQPNFTINVF